MDRDTATWLPVLEIDQPIVNLTTGATYRVRKFLGSGGFGSAYQVSQSGVRRKVATKLCLKVRVQPEAWHREAYFGQLLQRVPRAIAVFDSFATFVAAPRASRCHSTAWLRNSRDMVTSSRTCGDETDRGQNIGHAEKLRIYCESLSTFMKQAQSTAI